MAPVVKERLLRLSVAHYHNENVTEQQFHKWVTENHCARVAPICKRHGVVSYGMCFTPSSMRAVAQKLNADWGSRFVISDHHVQVEYYMRDMDAVYAVAADPEFRVLHGEEGPFVSRLHVVASVGWVEVYVENGRVVNLVEGKPTYPEFAVMADAA